MKLICIVQVKRTALHYAACGGHVDIMSLLLQHKADVNIKDEVSYNSKDKSKVGIIKSTETRNDAYLCEKIANISMFIMPL